MTDDRQFCGRTRREFLWQAGGGFTGLALSGMLANDGYFGTAAASELKTPAKFVNPMAPKPPMLPAKAKAVIFVFCYGGPEPRRHVRLQAELYPLDGKTIPIKTFGRGGHKAEGGSSARSGSSSTTASAARWCPTCSPTSASASTTWRSSTACTPRARSTARRC
jgi:hypothetical protein